MLASETLNLRRLIVQQGLTASQVAAKTGLDRRTVRAVLSGSAKPHLRTIHRLAEGLGVSSDEFYVEPSQLAYRQFDRQTNPVAEEVIHEHPELFADWTIADFDELHSRFGAGGAMTRAGVLEAAQAMNRRRTVHEKLAVLLESSSGELARTMIELLYEQTIVRGDCQEQTSAAAGVRRG
ncbi:MAG: helix-turn-helix transcriptional regulator [Pirellulales bacterium]|jgi:transcriptional regulator with XRE-family HTH domain|nr:helix-turn-helix transcriptional regulator [Thermoguttaceae bacterium]MDD4787649.1 helix-turn-helix transcriptional regulator [Pirellulales bacterium]MDI9446019.1 helix-turn-helix transcriptional regulator [Planctomycetota bacterium]NLZ01083.1 helix-turn-helix transcriptional regulator [Pirellulaceae bacterium]